MHIGCCAKRILCSKWPGWREAFKAFFRGAEAPRGLSRTDLPRRVAKCGMEASLFSPIYSRGCWRGKPSGGMGLIGCQGHRETLVSLLPRRREPGINHNLDSPLRGNDGFFAVRRCPHQSGGHLPVYLPPVPNLDDFHHHLGLLDAIEDAVVILPDPVAFLGGQFFRARGRGSSRRASMGARRRFTSSLGRPRKSLATEGRTRNS